MVEIKAAAVMNAGWEDESVASMSAEYARLQKEALKKEAKGGPDNSFNPEEWGLDGS